MLQLLEAQTKALKGNAGVVTYEEWIQTFFFLQQSVPRGHSVGLLARPLTLWPAGLPSNSVACCPVLSFCGLLAHPLIPWPAGLSSQQSVILYILSDKSFCQMGILITQMQIFLGLTSIFSLLTCPDSWLHWDLSRKTPLNIFYSQNFICRNGSQIMAPHARITYLI